MTLNVKNNRNSLGNALFKPHINAWLQGNYYRLSSVFSKLSNCELKPNIYVFHAPRVFVGQMSCLTQGLCGGEVWVFSDGLTGGSHMEQQPYCSCGVFPLSISTYLSIGFKKLIITQICQTVTAHFLTLRFLSIQRQALFLNSIYLLL